MPSFPTKEALQSAVASIKREHGEWNYDIPLPFGVWTRDGRGLPHTRLKRIVQMAADVAGKPLKDCRVLDLACLDGQFAIEFALQGAQAVGIEIRESHVVKARFAAQALGLQNVEFHQGDVRDLSAAKHGRFDIVVCSGILYHLLAEDAINLVRAMHEVASRLVIIDTEHSLAPWQRIVTPGGKTYEGQPVREHADDASDETRQANPWASWDNTTSFWFSRASLVNLLRHTGFTSVYECLAPTHLNYGQPGRESATRITLVAMKGGPVVLATSPAASALDEDMPEDNDAAPVQRAVLPPGVTTARSVAASTAATAEPRKPPRGLLARVLRQIVNSRR
jgi:SAM-dependent methyltransferase